MSKKRRTAAPNHVARWLGVIVLLMGAACAEQPAENESPVGETAVDNQNINQTALNDMLLAAAEAGDADEIERLLAQGADIETSNRSGVTPLIAAAYRNHLDAAQLLINAGADVNVQDVTQQSAYLISTSEGYVELLQLTLAAGADVHSTDSFNGTGLIRAADRGHVEIIRELLTTDIDIDHVNRLGWTALLEAVILGDGGPRHTETVRLLVEAGADVTIADNGGVTALEHARRRGFSEMVAIMAGSGQSNAPPTIAVEATEAATVISTPIATPHPLEPFTLDGMRQRDASGGEIRIRTMLDETEAYSRSYIDYPSDGLTITGLMFAPHGAGPFPVLILLHGFYSRDFYFSGAGTEQAADYFAQNGYLVIAPDLRSWGESDSGLSLFHMGLVSDVRNLIDALPSLPQTDADRVGLWGHSMGGGIATKLLVVDQRVDAAVLYAPNSADDADLIARWGIGCLPGQTEDVGCNPADIIPAGTPPHVVEAYQVAATDPEFLQRVAPLYHLDAVAAPVQIHIGTADGAGLAETPPSWSAKLARGLENAGKTVAYFEYADQGHFFGGQSWSTMMARSLQLFDEVLRAGS